MLRGSRSDHDENTLQEVQGRRGSLFRMRVSVVKMRDPQAPKGGILLAASALPQCLNMAMHFLGEKTSKHQTPKQVPQKKEEENGEELDKRPKQRPEQSLCWNMTTLQGQLHSQGICSNQPAATEGSPEKEEGVRIPWAQFCRGAQRSNSLKSLFSSLEQQAPSMSSATCYKDHR